MSKAFTREDDDGAPLIVPARAPMPPGIPNYVTARGLSELRGEMKRLEEERGRLIAGGRGHTEGSVGGPGDPKRPLVLLDARIGTLASRIGSAILVEPPEVGAAHEVRFGATVTVRRPGAPIDETRRFTLVGVDEADAATGRLAFVAPLARGLIGGKVGDVVTVQGRGGEEEELEIAGVEYEATSPAKSLS